MSIVKGNHCAYDTHYHIVFPVKYRKALLEPPITAAIKEIAAAMTERYDIWFEQIGTDNDHIHILCSFHPKYSGSDIVRMFKSITAKYIFRHHSEVKTKLWGGKFWTQGYYANTVGNASMDIITNYVKQQGHPDYQQLHTAPLQAALFTT